MENKVNFKEIAAYCKDEYEQKCKNSGYKASYRVYYVAITAEGKMRVSQTPHILSDAERCYLIHTWSEKAVTCWYATYDIQCINADGEVSKGNLDDDYSICISSARYNTLETIHLMKNGERLYSSSLWENASLVLAQKLVYVWELYQMCKKETQTLEESRILCRSHLRKRRSKRLKTNLPTHRCKCSFWKRRSTSIKRDWTSSSPHSNPECKSLYFKPEDLPLAVSSEDSLALHIAI